MPLVLLLANRGNPDRDQDPSRPLYGCPFDRHFPLPDSDPFPEASRLCREYITACDLGGGNWAGGAISGDLGEIVAHVSYNGKVWAGAEYVAGASPLYVPA